MKRLQWLLLVAVLLPLLPGLIVAAAQRVEAVKALELRAEPAAATASRGWVEKGEQGDQLGRRGGWVRVQFSDRQGWLRVWQVRPAESGNALLHGLERFSRSIAGLFSSDGGGVQQDGVTATIGVRGLDGGEFTSAAPDPAALQRVRGLRASRDEAASFARSAGLQRRQLSTPESQPAQNWDDW